MTRPTDLLPEGLEDRLPASAARITTAMRACLDVLHRHGYERVRPPLLEFERSLASRMQGIRTQAMFRFVDPASLRTLALRSDITPQVGRIAATSMKAAPRPLRLAYCGETALIRASQLDPARERLQLGAELVGADTIAAASEIAMVAIEALQAAGLTGISVDFTLPDLVDTLAERDGDTDPDQIEAIRRELDTKDAGGLRDAGGEAYLPLLYAAGPFDRALADLRAFDAGGALGTRLDGLEAIAARIAAVHGDAVRLTLDPTERYGFEYQTWFGFTLYAEGLRGAAGRGGTYRIGGSEEAATGFSLYVDHLAEAAPEAERGRAIYLPLGHDVEAAARLRAEGWRTLAQLGEGEDAAALGCTHVLEGAGVKELEQDR
ncbi:ATP phosphoribosyltransferase regulatory subunit [Erythrobacter sp. HL-111]|uniref:ATP phosphoribosyltransferase regulatory subunit n=1 Tax=Erythrobacter sp. HL-111 TaxID=1798193 RepID=UPI0006DAD372|nr:ATP phosphoribosyltransferase regulatory subunit [Erythrobacter sp. HL-111]KPP86652.1 MAG: ATP phosphoribosyltransferase regulatory subunit HisZ [Erythrobacteraceae bacterium HL-111]SDR67790.1 ATP phosphoribosyltransferase regulatory subunit [Erythrobacter sp. HL-111]